MRLALLWRSHAAALDGFEAACDAAATVLDPAIPLDCKRFCDASKRCWPRRNCACRTIVATWCM